MTSFDGEDATRGGEVRFRGYGSCGAEIGGYADAFEDGCGGDKGRDGGYTECICAFCCGWGTSGCCTSVRYATIIIELWGLTLQSASQKADVRGLVV